MNPQTRIYVAGHRGLVGSALCRMLESAKYCNLLLRTSDELDLRNQQETFRFFEVEKPEVVILAAAKVGGIYANNTYRAEFIYDNLAIQNNVIHAAYQTGVKKLIFLGSSCIYPKLAPQPLKEEALLTGLLEPTNEPYAIAKIAGIKMCQAYRAQYGCDFISLMPTNLYGPNDNFDLENSHVLPALIRKFHEAAQTHAPSVTLWGTGTPRREFLHVDDLADACYFILHNQVASDLVNVGTGTDVSILELAHLIKDITGYTGEIVFDTTQPDGTPRKLLNVSLMESMGWKAKIGLHEGLRMTYEWYKRSAGALCQV